MLRKQDDYNELDLYNKIFNDLDTLFKNGYIYPKLKPKAGFWGSYENALILLER